MGLDAIDQVDAAGVDRATGDLVLTIVDSWGWEDEIAHLRALQAKLNAYFEFVGSGQVFEEHSEARGRRVVIDVVWRMPPLASGTALLLEAHRVAAELGVSVRGRVDEH